MGRKDWLGVKLKGATMQHAIQQDACSCGVFVMQVFFLNFYMDIYFHHNVTSHTYLQQFLFKIGKEIVRMFPEVPSQVYISHFMTKPRHVFLGCTEEILTASGD